MSLTLPAHAKVNLTLEVLCKRLDGYHEIASVLQTISLADTLEFDLNDKLELRCNVPSLQSPDNLALKAARLLQEASGGRRGASITLTKKIPIAGGLGSGATDAATTLVGLNRLWGLGLTAPALLELAAALGSDVPFFLLGGTALARGRGEKVTKLAAAPVTYMVLLSPSVAPTPRKTATLYSQLEECHFTRGQYTENLVQELQATGELRVSMLYNAFEQVAFAFFAGLSEHRTSLLRAGATTVHLAGSGPCLFAPVRGEAEAKAILKRLPDVGAEVLLVRTVDAPLLPPLRDAPC